jgi:hypothetical protein
VVQTGDSWSIIHDTHFNYAGGTAFGLGQPAPDYDLWFREGIIVPEPSTTVLFALGLFVFFRARRAI